MQSSRSESPAPAIRWLPLLVGLAILVVIAAIGDYYGFRVRLGGPAEPGRRTLAYINRGEHFLWLTFILLLCPACVLVAHGISGRLEPWLRRVLRRVEALDTKASCWLWCGLVLALWLVYRAGRWFLLRDYAVTGDETMIRFGGQIWAMGQLSAERFWPEGVFTEAFTLIRDGRIASMDWVGSIAVAALAEVTRLGPWLYAAISALTALWVIWTVRHLLGSRSTWLAALFWIASPMAWTLSITEHTHMVSRMFIALGWLAFAKLFHRSEAPVVEAAEHRRALLWAAVLGGAVGASFLCRFYETVSMMAPAGIALVVSALKHRGTRLRQLGVTLLSFAPFAVVYLWYNWTMTGSPLVTPRDLVWAAEGWAETEIWRSAGQNLGFNLLQLALWPLGLLGLPLAWLGLATSSSIRFVSRMLGLGLLCQLGIALGHADIGVHSVGPIHYSEALPVLIVLAVIGVHDLGRWLIEQRLTHLPIFSLGAGYLAGVVAYGGIYAVSLHNLGQVADIPARAVREAGIENAFVIAPSPGRMGRMMRGATGSWQLAHSPPHPRIDDPVIYVPEDVDVELLRRAFPERKLYELKVNRRTATGKVVPWTPPTPNPTMPTPDAQRPTKKRRKPAHPSTAPQNQDDAP